MVDMSVRDLPAPMRRVQPRDRLRWGSGLLALALLVGACSSSAPANADVAAADDRWRTIPLRDVRSGQEFRIEDLDGKVVAIETMAIWCANCRTQQLQAQEALDRLADPDLVYVSLDVDSNERAEELAEYARREGFEWHFAVASPELSRSLAASFGDQVLSPPATPLLVVGPDGQVVEHGIGIKRADQLVALFEEHLP